MGPAKRDLASLASLDPAKRDRMIASSDAAHALQDGEIGV